MGRITPEKLLKKEMTRREFLQFSGSAVLILFGLSNVLQLIRHMKKTAEEPAASVTTEASHGFGSRKFGA